MNRMLLIIILIFIVILCLLVGLIINNNSRENDLKRFNNIYEQYLEKELLGTEVASIINRVIDNNERRGVRKDEKGYYIDNEENSIKIDIKMITIDKTFEMESIYNKGMTDFVQHFNLIKFKCSDIKYHKQTGKVSKITFEQLEE